LSPFGVKLPRRWLPAVGTFRKGRIAIFPGCSFEFFMRDIVVDMATALSKAGFEVIFPEGLSCCGQAVYNSGDFETARLMVQRNIDVLASFDHVVTGCATCGSAFKSYGSWFDETDSMHAAAVDFTRKCMDFTQLLDEVGFKPPTADPSVDTVTYHDPCHMRWHQGIVDAPRRLLQSVPGISYREMEGADACCGLGGAFGLSHRDISLQLLDAKMAAIRHSGARTVVSACPGCLLHLKAGARRHQLPVQVVHISRLMAGKSEARNGCN
jgi:glycolate oxidase iron-sulfur subunit